MVFSEIQIVFKMSEIVGSESPPLFCHNTIIPPKVVISDSNVKFVQGSWCFFRKQTDPSSGKKGKIFIFPMTQTLCIIQPVS